MTAFSWRFGFQGSWSTAGNWTPSGGPPSAGTDSAVISAGLFAFTVTLDVNETIGALSIGNSSATLDIGNKQLTVTNAGGLAGTVTFSAGIISIGGGTLSATGGFSVTGGASISGFGTLIGTIAGAGVYEASLGTLRIESTVLASATGLEIFNDSASILRLDSSVASGAVITFIGSTGTLDLTDISGNVLQGFSGTIAGLTVGGSATVPTNQIDLATITPGNITSASLNTGTDIITVTTTGGSFTLQLSGSYAASTRVARIADGATTGTDLFLVAGRAFSWASAASGNWSAAGDWTPSGGPPSTSADTADISAFGSLYTVHLDVNETVGALTMGTIDPTLDIGSNQLTVTNAGGQAGTVTVTNANISINGGTLSATNGFLVTGAGEIFGAGTLIGTIAGAGRYGATGGTLRIESAVPASATGLAINSVSGSVLELDGTVASGAVITFFGSAGTLDLTDISGNVLQGFSGTIAGLNVGGSATVPTNQIDLATLAKANITAASLNTSTDVVTVTTSGGSFTLQLSGSYAAGTFVDMITDGASTGTDLFLSSVACYCRRTMVLTDRGEVPVEDLAIGDKVVTLSGEAKPIKWIGRRSYDGRFVRSNRDVLPIVVKAGALADGVPARDLYLSPEHSLYFDGVLVQAMHLVNGATIVQAEAVDRVEYFHIELDTHGVIFAEGAPAESFVDCDNRMMFANAAEYDGLYPEDDRPRWKFCRPRLEWGSQELTIIRAALLGRAAACGYMLERDPDLHLIADGATIRPEPLADGVYRFTVPAGVTDLDLASRSVVPAEVSTSSTDSRRLGVPLRCLLLSDGEMSLEVRHSHSGLCDGFQEAEATHRWTAGLARIPAAWLRPFAGTLTLDVHLASSELAYVVPPPAADAISATA